MKMNRNSDRTLVVHKNWHNYNVLLLSWTLWRSRAKILNKRLLNGLLEKKFTENLVIAIGGSHDISTTRIVSLIRRAIRWVRGGGGKRKRSRISCSASLRRVVLRQSTYVSFWGVRSEATGRHVFGRDDGRQEYVSVWRLEFSGQDGTDAKPMLQVDRVRCVFSFFHSTLRTVAEAKRCCNVRRTVCGRHAYRTAVIKPGLTYLYQKMFLLTDISSNVSVKIIRVSISRIFNYLHKRTYVFLWKRCKV